MADFTNISRSHNYMIGNQIFILGDIDSENTYELLGRLAAFVDNMQPVDIAADSSISVVNPYHINDEMPTASNNITSDSVINPYKIDTTPVIDIYISSPGGSMYSTNSIISLLNIARSKGAKIRTTIMGRAESAASVIAVQGDRGLRIINENAFHFIHYGTIHNINNSEPSAAANRIHSDYLLNQTKQTYLAHTNLTQKQINKMMQAETGFIYPQDCLKYGLADWILTRQGKFITR